MDFNRVIIFPEDYYRYPLDPRYPRPGDARYYKDDPYPNIKNVPVRRFTIYPESSQLPYIRKILTQEPIHDLRIQEPEVIRLPVRIMHYIRDVSISTENDDIQNCLPEVVDFTLRCGPRNIELYGIRNYDYNASYTRLEREGFNVQELRSRLSGLIVDGCENFNIRDISQWNLTSLQIHEVNEIDQDQDLLTHLPVSLQSLDISSSGNWDLRHISRFKNLTSLGIQGYHIENPDDLKYIPFKKLKLFRIGYNVSINTRYTMASTMWALYDYIHVLYPHIEISVKHMFYDPHVTPPEQITGRVRVYKSGISGEVWYILARLGLQDRVRDHVPDSLIKK